MKKQLLSVAAILASTIVFLIGNGLLGTLLPVRAHIAQFSDLAIGLVGSAYFVGFIAGCYAGPRLLAHAGHARLFAAGAGIAAATTLAQSLLVGEFSWIVLRGLFGFAAAGLFMVIESWLNDRATNETRGRIFGSYLTVNFIGLIIGQSLFASARPSSYSLFSLAAISYALCMIPVVLTRSTPAVHAHVPELRPMRLFKLSPVGVAGCLGVGLSNAAVWTFAPIYAQGHGLTRGYLSAFMIVFTLGGALIQLPLGRLSDLTDRRYIIIGIALCAAVAGVALYLYGGESRALTLALIALFGMAALPLYGMSVAHANDRLPREMFVEASATLLLINAVASAIGPVIAALVTARFGMDSLFLYTATIHVALLAFTLMRIGVTAKPEEATREPFEPVPQQSTPTALELDPRSPESEDVPTAA